MRPLTGAEQRRVEENMGLVGQVIKDCVHQYSNGVYDYDDLKQIGYMGLCKAVLTDKPGRGEFSTYAYIVIRNELYSALEYSTRRPRRWPLIRRSCRFRSPASLWNSRWYAENC